MKRYAMSTHCVKVISLCVLALGGLALLWTTVTVSMPVPMRILDFIAREWPDAVAQGMGTGEYVVATIELTNWSKRSVVYLGRGPKSAEYYLLHQTATAWKETSGDRGFCGTGVEQCTLAPSQTAIFQAFVDRDKPCKVALGYSDRPPSRFWQRLPRWLAHLLPWGSGWSTATTGAIDLRGASGLMVRRPNPFFKPPQEIRDVEAAAQRGDAQPQFRLAGRYLPGAGLDRNVVEALRWYEAAAARGHAEAAYNLGTIYEYGLGTNSDASRAMEWYRRASDRGQLEHRKGSGQWLPDDGVHRHEAPIC
jgi:TPR repeat protein